MTHIHFVLSCVSVSSSCASEADLFTISRKIPLLITPVTFEMAPATFKVAWKKRLDNSCHIAFELALSVTQEKKLKINIIPLQRTHYKIQYCFINSMENAESTIMKYQRFLL